MVRRFFTAAADVVVPVVRFREYFPRADCPIIQRAENLNKEDNIEQEKRTKRGCR
jgi:hypothetical protein